MLPVPSDFSAIPSSDFVEFPALLKPVFIARVLRFACNKFFRPIELAYTNTAFFDTIFNLDSAMVLWKNNFKYDGTPLTQQSKNWSTGIRIMNTATEEQENLRSFLKIYINSCRAGIPFITSALLRADISIKFTDPKNKNKIKKRSPSPSLTTTEQQHQVLHIHEYELEHLYCEKESYSYKKLPMHTIPQADPVLFSNVLHNSVRPSYNKTLNIGNYKAKVGMKGLFDAVISGRLYVVQAILEASCVGSPLAKPLTQTNHRDQTILHLAASCGNYEMCKVILENCAPVSEAVARNSSPPHDLLLKEDKNTRIPLHYAANTNDAKLLKLLSESGEGENRVSWVDQPDSDKCTTLLYSCSAGNLGAVRELLKLGADPKMKTKNNLSCLHLVSTTNAHQNSSSSSSFESNNNNNKRSAAGDEEENDDTATQIARLLLEKGADISEKDDVGKTCLHYAATVANARLVRFLEKQEGIDRNVADKKGNRPLHCCGNNAEIVHLLLNSNENSTSTKTTKQHQEECVNAVNARNSDSEAPIHLAAKHGCSKTLIALLQHGARVDVVGKNRSTPLHYAVQNDQMECVELLMRARANPAVRNGNGESCMALAKEKVESRGNSRKERAIFALLSR